MRMKYNQCIGQWLEAEINSKIVWICDNDGEETLTRT